MLDEICARRIAYVKLGYEPLPCAGKAPRPPKWQEITIDIDTAAAWGNAFPTAVNTGIRTRRTPGVDIDVYDAAVADQIEQALRAMFPDARLLKRVGQPPKRLIPFRCDAPFKKIIAMFKAPDGTIHKVEVLGDGQQFIADGIHPDTGTPYAWEGGDLLSVAREHLPLFDEATARRFVSEASAIMAAAGWIEVDSRGNPKGDRAKTKANGKTNAAASGSTIYGRSALRDECAKLAAMPKDSGRNNALNSAAFNLHQLVAGGELDEEKDQVHYRLFAAAEKCGLVAEDGPAQVWKTIESGAKAGRAEPRRAPAANGSDRDDKADQPDHGADDVVLCTVAADELAMCGVEWLWPGRFALGKFGLIAGMPDMGKGQIAAFISAAVTAGVELPCDEGTAPQGDVIWFNAEDDARDTVKPRLIAAGADPKRVHFVNGARADGKDRMFSLVSDLEVLRKQIKRIGNVILVIIDPVSAYLGVGKVDGRSATDVRGILSPMKNMIEELHISLIGIAHFNKKDDVKSALLRVSDSIAYVAAARHVYAVLDDPEDKNSKLFVKAKNNLARDAKALRYGMGVKKVGHDAKLGVDIEGAFIVWHPQHVEITANEAMQAAGGHTAKREAKEFLLERVGADGAKAEDLIEEAKQEGIAKRTLDRAKKELGIKSRKTPSKFNGEWFWELPPKNTHHP